MAQFALFPTALGACGIAWSGETVVPIHLPETSAAETADLAFIACDFGRLDDLAAKVYAAAREIPPGQTRTYGDLARQIAERLFAGEHASGSCPGMSGKRRSGTLAGAPSPIGSPPAPTCTLPGGLPVTSYRRPASAARVPNGFVSSDLVGAWRRGLVSACRLPDPAQAAAPGRPADGRTS